MSNNSSFEYMFYCRDCECKLFVIHLYTEISEFQYTDRERLMLYEGRRFEEFEEYGEFDYDHEIIYLKPISIDHYEDIDFDIDLYEEELSSYPNEKTYDEPIIDKESEEFYVYCHGCDHEKEFGWSRPDRGGTIWPVECSDFDPRKCWPEPKFRDSWIEKGWCILDTN